MYYRLSQTFIEGKLCQRFAVLEPPKTDPIPSASHPNERILIFMIAEKDASKSDERHVKDRCNTNLLTQKKTGGKHIMGNRGMTNWKLGTFFVVVLMLISGLFSNTPMAAAGNGDGRITVRLDARDDPTSNVVADKHP